jgi:aminoglycoside phosphotransferase family enzyme/predicted kinase
MSHQPEWICGLLEADAYPHAVSGLRLIETHISWVFLTGEYAYKVKKPVDLGFVDFSTLERRKFFCEEELRLNQRTADHLYLDVVPIGFVNGKPKVGLQPAADYAVRMRQFPADARLDRRLEAGRVEAEDMRKTASLLASFHSQLPPRTGVDPDEAAERASQPALDNFLHLEGSHISKESRRQIDAIEAWTLEQVEILIPAFKQREDEGFIRECHGDLHLANLFEQDGRIYPYDCLEFNPDLRWIDQVSDIAFLVMDLMARDRTDLAYTFLNTWLEESGDYDGLVVLRFYLVYRCMVRLKVASIQTEQLHEDVRGEHALKTRQYLDLARALMDTPDHPSMVLMYGFSGSGKTYISGKLVTAMPAIRVRSDLERKRLHGLPRHQHSKSGIESGLYSGAATERTYMILARHCETGLRTGFNMIADAAFLNREWRSRFLDLALRLGARATIMECSAPLKTLQARIRQRAAEGLDESDADLAVLEYQMTHFDPLDNEERLLAVQDFRNLSLIETHSTICARD